MIFYEKTTFLRAEKCCQTVQISESQVIIILYYDERKSFQILKQARGGSKRKKKKNYYCISRNYQSNDRKG